MDFWVFVSDELFKLQIFVLCHMRGIDNSLLVFNFQVIYVAPPEATPSRFALSSFRCAPLRPANQLRPPQQINLFINMNFILILRIKCCARGGAHLAAERVGAERRRKSEAQPNGEGVAAGGATVI